MSEIWAYYATELISGQVIVDLPLVDFSGEVSLAGGPMTAKLPLLDLSADQREMYLDSTIPGRYTILAVRNGVPQGEWIIWQRTRANDLSTVGLSGAQIKSFLERRVSQTKTYSATEQLDIAKDLVLTGFGASPQGNGAVAITVGSYTPSGKARDREYKQCDGTIGQRLKELGEVIDGFDTYVTSEWTGGAHQTPTVTRTVRFGYPRAGSDQDLVLEDRHVLSFELAEDARDLASRAYTVGDSGLISTYEDDRLVTVGRLPYLEKSASYTSVTQQATLDSYARALWDDSQVSALPGSLTVLADVQPGIGDWSLGDVVTVQLEESINFPVGVRVDVRIIGWTFKPPRSGPETLSLAITQEGSLGDYSGNPIAVW
jgi:hypothetical protein